MPITQIGLACRRLLRAEASPPVRFPTLALPSSFLMAFKIGRRVPSRYCESGRREQTTCVGEEEGLALNHVLRSTSRVTGTWAQPTCRGYDGFRCSSKEPGFWGGPLPLGIQNSIKQCQTDNLLCSPQRDLQSKAAARLDVSVLSHAGALQRWLERSWSHDYPQRRISYNALSYFSTPSLCHRFRKIKLLTQKCRKLMLLVME